MLVVLVVLLAVKGFAFINSLTYSAEAYEAAGKLTKQAGARSPASASPPS